LHWSTSAKALSHFGTGGTTLLPMHDGYGSDIFLTLQNCTSAFRTKCKPWVSNPVIAVPAAYAGIIKYLRGMELLGVHHHILNFGNQFLSVKKRRCSDRQQVGTAGHRGDDRHCR
jgi:hypothetical protein